MALNRLPAEVVQAFVETSRRAQGLPLTITDPGVLQSVVVLLKPSPGRAAPQRRSPRNARPA